MENVINYIEQQYIIDSIKTDTSNYIFERLNSSILQELAKQLKNQKNDEKEQKKHDSWVSIYSKDFKDIFGGYHVVSWDKITDDDIIEYNYNGQAKNDREIDKTVRSIIKGDKNALVLIKDKENDLFTYVIFTYGEMYHLETKGNSHAGSKTGYNTGGRRSSWHDLNQKEKLDLIQNHTIYIIDNIKKFSEDRGNKRSERTKAQKGMVLLDEYSLKSLAEQNMKRYKEIVAKNKANRLNNTELLDECNELIKKSSDLAVQIAKDPVKYADVLSDISNLTLYIYDTRKYVGPTKYNRQGYYSGVNGLLPIITKYTKTLKDIQSNGGYEYQRKELDEQQKSLKQSVEKVKELIKKVEEKL